MAISRAAETRSIGWAYWGSVGLVGFGEVVLWWAIFRVSSARSLLWESLFTDLISGGSALRARLTNRKVASARLAT